MAFRFKRRESVADGFNRIAGELFEAMLGELRGETGPDVHEIRKCCKMLRALLRLLRGAIDRDARMSQSQAIRKLGDSLAAARDAETRLATLESLVGVSGLGERAEFQNVRALLVAEAGSVRRRLRASTDSRAAIQKVEAARAGVLALELERTGWRAIERGLRRAYARARGAFHLARKTPRPDIRHAWRARAKELWYHVRLLEGARPKKLGRIARELDALGELLGDEHDLAVLRKHIATRRTTRISTLEHETLARLIDTRIADIRVVADELGASIYNEKPRAFLRSIEAWWHSWRA